MFQDHTASISTATQSQNLMPSGEQSQESRSLKHDQVILLTYVLLNAWLLVFTVIILTELTELSWLMNLPISLKSDGQGAVSSGKQPDLDVNLTSPSSLVVNDRPIYRLSL